jgi:paired amphipathic helix protein Sin3a
VAQESHSAPMQIHQPVAVAPSTRTIHGPNGLLGQPGPLGGPSTLAAPMGGPNASGGMFGNPPVQQGDTTPRMQHTVQPPPPQASMLMPFGGPPGQMAMGQGQQPILNVSVLQMDDLLLYSNAYRTRFRTWTKSKYNLPISQTSIIASLTS